MDTVSLTSGDLEIDSQDKLKLRIKTQELISFIHQSKKRKFHCTTNKSTTNVDPYRWFRFFLGKREKEKFSWESNRMLKFFFSCRFLSPSQPILLYLIVVIDFFFFVLRWFWKEQMDFHNISRISPPISSSLSTPKSSLYSLR